MFNLVSDAKQFHKAAASAADIRVETYLEDAADLIKAHSLEDETSDDAEFLAKAKRCELRLFEYLWETKGYIENRSISGLSSTVYTKNDVVKSILKNSLGDYYYKPPVWLTSSGSRRPQSKYHF